MLNLLHIENIAVIERADIDFSEGFTVLTGETGAGKSIIIDSIGAIMGQRTSKELIRNGAKKGFVSAVFSNISLALQQKIKELGLEGDDDSTLHIQRELSAEGKSVSRINMRPVTASVLKSISPYLINIHGQHDGQKLMDEQYHIDFLDSFCNAKELLDAFLPLYNELFALKRAISALEKSEQERIQRIDMLKFQEEEISSAELKADEEELLVDRKTIFDHAGSLAFSLENVHNLLNGDDDTTGVVEKLSSASNILSSISNISEEIESFYNKMEDVKYLAMDLRDEISSTKSKIDFSEQERDYVEERLDTISRLKRKYGSTIAEILKYHETICNELNDLQFSDEKKLALVSEYKQVLAKAKEIGKTLSQRRKEAAKKLESSIIEQLSELDMSKVKLSINVETQPKLTPKGMDKVEFLIATNSGETLKPLSKIASGGELSRIMLAIKNVLTATEDVGTLIFDEIDAGVSGRAAQKIAKKLYTISDKKQTLCVTHLPQIASMGDNHLLIAKRYIDDKTYTSVDAVIGDNRVDELARMISGDDITEASRVNASELINNATEYKNSQREVL